MLLKASHSVCEDNRFERIGATGIGLAAERFWMEGPFPRDVRIQNNTLKACNLMLHGRHSETGKLGAISVVSVAGNRMTSGRQNTGIVIRNNVIRNTAACGIFASNIADSRIVGNRISGACQMEPVRPDMPNAGIYIDAAGPLVLEENRVSDPGPFCNEEIQFGPLVSRESIEGGRHP